MTEQTRPIFDFYPAEISDEAVVERNKNQKWSGHVRTDTVGASEIGACARQVVMDKHDVDPDPDFEQDYGALERGHAVEEWYVQTLVEGLAKANNGIKLDFAADEGQKTLVRGSQSATPDGVFKAYGDTLIGIVDPETGEALGVEYLYNEVKSIDPRAFETLKGPKHQHVLQCQQGMDLVRSLTDYKPDYAVITYIDASFYSLKRTYIIKFDPVIAARLRPRADKLMYEHSATNLPLPEERLAGGKLCQYCKFKRRCWGEDISTMPGQVAPVPDDVIAEVSDLVSVVQDARDLIDKYETIKKTAEYNLSEIARKHGTKNIKGDFGSVSVFGRYPAQPLDREAMEKDGIDLTKYLKPVDMYPVVMIRAKKSEGEYKRAKPPKAKLD